MELIENRYYNPSRLNNTTYLLMMALEEYFGKEIFKGDGSRIFYGSQEFAFRQRMNKLYPTLTPPYTSISASQMQFPFANYFRNTGWRIDSRPAIQNATAALIGFELSPEIPIPVRFLQTEMDFSLTFYFDRDDDAQNCYDILMWIQNPSPKQFSFPGLMYKNYKADIPIILKTDNITWTNQYKENDWLQKNRIIVVSATVNIKSVLLDQFAQGTSSSLFEVLPAESDIGKFYITTESILDFLSFKNDPVLNKENIVFDILANFTPDPTLDATFAISEETLNSAVLTWDYNPLASELYDNTVLIVFDSGQQARVPLSDKTYTITELEPESTYNVAIYFTSTSGSIIKMSQIIETVAPEAKKELKGMVGLEF
jgi:hypothetical protein